jgi:hypothetical protein
VAKSAAAAKRRESDRRALCEDLLALRIKHAAVFAQMDGLKASLIVAAGAEGYREVFAGKGQVTVAAAKGKEFKGDLPEVEPAAFHALSDAKRQKLIDDGIVKLVPVWTRDFHGRVDMKTF